ncbi:MAG: 4a-hydroxytetrahydrobiopterin dehydratase [Acidimicrobiia bacterium]|nr:4a-hydroxytetrahydrobiopterin dehydratase [Acidimicrobiia bacterium]
MALPPALSSDELTTALRGLHPDWHISADGKLHRSLVFPDFSAAFGCMTEIAIHAEKLNHHPEWSNTYNRVEIDLITHDVPAITQYDVDLAARIDAAAGRAD